MELAQASSLITGAIAAGRPANAYLLVGETRGNCAALERMIFKHLFPEDRERAIEGEHPDVLIVEPTGKLRIITVDTINGVVDKLSATAYSGGWKVGVIHCADRLSVRHEAANAFLKVLEEPPPQTMFLLTTDSPEGLLPTIVSRCQRVDLPRGEGLLDGEGYRAVAEVFEGSLGGVYERSLAAKHLAATLAALKDESADEDIPLVRKAFYRTIMKFVRGWMVDKRLEYYRSFRNLTAVEEAYRQSEKSMNDEAVLSFLLDRLAVPS